MNVDHISKRGWFSSACQAKIGKAARLKLHLQFACISMEEAKVAPALLVTKSFQKLPGKNEEKPTHPEKLLSPLNGREEISRCHLPGSSENVQDFSV